MPSVDIWQGWLDSNQRMRESKSLALPLGDTPVWKKRKQGLGSLPIPVLRVGWVMGLEPTTPGTTIRCSNQLSYTHHIYIRTGSCLTFSALQGKSGTPEGTRTPGLLLRRQLLYPAELLAQMNGAGDGNRTRIPSLEGWCPGHCATPACALRGNRQLCNNSTDSPPLSRRIFSSIPLFSCASSAWARKCRKTGAASTASLRRS